MRFRAVTAALLLCAAPCLAGGPRYVAGGSFFNSAVYGKPIVWAGGGKVSYYLDQGALSSFANNETAAAMVAAAAAPWNGVPLATVQVTSGGALDEDVNGSNVNGSGENITWPEDVESAAKPVAILFDADGSIVDALIGPDASAPSGCLTNAVTSRVDEFSTAGNITHALIILNGLCATSTEQVTNMQYLLEREFGRVLGLGWSQANDNVITRSPAPQAATYQGWPVMHPLNLNCGGNNYSCLGDAFSLRMDDRAALAHLYPAASFAKSTAEIFGYITFANGQGMQGVNVVATRLWTGTTTPDYSSVVSGTSGVLFTGNFGSSVGGRTDANGNPLQMFSSSAAWAEGYFDLPGLEIPAGSASADYVLTFEPVNSLYTAAYSVGPELLGTPLPSGTLPAPIYIRAIKAGSSTKYSFTIINSGATGAVISSQQAPVTIPASGSWRGAVTPWNTAVWASLNARPLRTFAVVAQALDEALTPSLRKLMPIVGVWNGSDTPGGGPDFATATAFNSRKTGATVVEGNTPGPNGAAGYAMNIAIADQRGDGRPDYNFVASILYGDSVSPAVLPLSGGQVVISGTGFRAGDMVLIGGKLATVALASTTALLVTAPAQNASGAQDVEIDDPQTGGYALMSSALTYTSTPGTQPVQTLVVISAPSSTVEAGFTTQNPFTVVALDSAGNPVPNATVTFSATGGQISLSSCVSASSCPVLTSATGVAQIAVLPRVAAAYTLSASVPIGASATTMFSAAASSTLRIAALPPLVNYYGGSAFNMNAVALATQNSAPVSGHPIEWKTKSGTLLATTSTDINGQAYDIFPVPAAAVGSSPQWFLACDGASANCATFYINAVKPNSPSLVLLSGTTQSVRRGTLFAPVTALATDGTIASVAIANLPITVTQACYSWNAFASAKQPPARLLAQSTTTVVSDLLGHLSIQPLQVSGSAAVTMLTLQQGSRTLAAIALYTSP